MRVAAVVLLAGVAWAGELKLVDVAPTPEKPGLSWLTSFEEASTVAARERKPLFLFFSAKW
jgi:hypothetical protein